MLKNKIYKIVELLAGAYGMPQPGSGVDPIEVLVRTILSQNTSDTNSLPAYRSLVSRFPGWREMSLASNDEIAAAIKHGGLAKVKATYIKKALQEIEKRQGSMELDFLGKLSVGEARDWLLQLPGVGLKTANCVLLFALGMPALPVDTHVNRVSHRLGLVSEGTNIEQAHQVLEKIVPPDIVFPFHVLLIEHGRKTCKARNPLCNTCVLNRLCPYFRTP
jgi:endonuclease-3